MVVHDPSTSDSPFPLRLKQARIARGLSLRELSEAMNHAVSHVSLAKYEEGAMKPSGEVVSALCSALGVSPDALFRTRTVNVAKVSFRKRKTFGEKEAAALVERIRAYLENYLEAEDILNAHLEYARPKVGKNDDARTVARALREFWGLGIEPIADMTELLEKNGIRVIEVDEPSDRFDGCQLEGLPVIVIGGRADRPVTRKRFTLAHELAHLILGEWFVALAEKALEKCMNAFASEFLFPAKALKAFFGFRRTSVTIEELRSAKLRFGISICAIVYAMHELGVIDDAAYRRFHTQTLPTWRTQKGGPVREPDDDRVSTLYREKPERFDRIVMRGVAEGMLSLSRAAGLLGRSISDLRRDTVPVV